MLVLSACSSAPPVTTTIAPEPATPPVSVTVPPPTTEPPTTTTTLPKEASRPDFDTWAIILESLPTTDHTVEAVFERAEGYAIPTGVLASDDYPSLNAGFWVIFNGPWSSRTEADARCDALRSDTPAVECYIRYLGVALDSPVGFEHGTSLVSVEGGYAIIDLATGNRVRTLENEAEARYRYRPELALDGTVAFFSGNVEDYWFSCESAQGFIDRLDLSTGVFEQYAVGSLARVSPGGQYLAYVESSTCINDPIDSGSLAVPDTIVVVDLGSDLATRWTPGAGAPGGADSFITSLAWGPNPSYLLAVLGDGSLRRLEPAQSMPVAELPVLIDDFVDPLVLTDRTRRSIDVIAGQSETSVLAHQWSSIGSGREGLGLDVNEIIEFDPRSGAIQRTIAVLDDTWPMVSLDSTYSNLLVTGQDGTVLFDSSGRFPVLDLGSEGADW